MKDNAPCHRAKKVMKWLKDKKVDVLEWSSNSMDLNPVEELWGTMKLKPKKRDTSTLPPEKAQANCETRIEHMQNQGK